MYRPTSCFLLTIQSSILCSKPYFEFRVSTYYGNILHMLTNKNLCSILSRPDHFPTHPGECELPGLESEVDSGCYHAYEVRAGSSVTGDVHVSVVLHGHGVLHQAVTQQTNVFYMARYL